MSFKSILSTAVLGSVIAAGNAYAVEFTTVLPQQSSIAFSYQQMGVKMDGKFKRFTAQLTYDPAKPAAAKAMFDVDLNSVDAGSSDADAELGGTPWFNTKAFPTARFVSTGIKSLAANKLEVSGTLTIKGKTQNIVVPASFSGSGAKGVFEGAFTIRRGDFSIGEGMWAKFDVVANDIVVKFRIAAQGK